MCQDQITKTVAKISKIHSDLCFGMAITISKEKIFFSNETLFGDFRFQDIKIGDEVDLEFFETERGLFAKSLIKKN